MEHWLYPQHFNTKTSEEGTSQLLLHEGSSLPAKNGLRTLPAIRPGCSGLLDKHTKTYIFGSSIVMFVKA